MTAGPTVGGEDAALYDQPGQIEPQPSGIFQALFDFMAERPKLPKDKTNPHFGSSFTSLEKMAELVDPILHKHDLLWLTLPTIVDGRPALSYTLVHVPTREHIDGAMLLYLDKENPQGLGSAHTYGRRQTKTTVLGLDAEADDDGNAGSQRPSSYGHRESRANSGTSIDLRSAGRGMSDRAINNARAEVGLTHIEEKGNDVWMSLGAIQPELATQLEEALAKARSGQSS